MVDLTNAVGAVRSISIAGLLLTMFSSAMLLSGCDRNDPPTSANSAKATQVPDGTRHVTLERFETQQGAFELGMAPCTAEGCAFEVRWLKANKLISSIALPINATDQTVEREAINFDWGADAGLYAWGAGADNSYVSTVARPVALDTDNVGLLVTQSFGYEHVTRLHRLVVPRDGKLVFLWEFTDGSDNSWSAAVVSPPSGITLFHRRYHYEQSEPDFLGVTRLMLNKIKTELIPAPKGIVAVALVVGDFISPSAAYRYQKDAAYKQQKSDTKYCFGRYDVYSSNSIPAIPKGRNALVRVFVRREEAEEEKKRLIQCGISFKISVVDIQSSPMLYQDKE